jgi:uncharacterized protein (DUF2252 family)
MSAAADTAASPRERAEQGREARQRAPRSTHAVWEAPADRPDPVDVLRREEAARVAELLPIRYGRMVASPFTFFRGSAAVMAADLAGTPTSGFTVQLCGDAHLSNFGGFAAPDRELVFDVNDFDETLPGPWEWDVKRLAASVAIAGRERGFDARERRGAVGATVRAYREAVRGFARMRKLDVWYARLDVAGVAERWGGEVTRKQTRRVQRSVAKARAKDSLEALTRLTERRDGRLRIVSDPPLVVPIEDELPVGMEESVEDEVRRLMSSYAASIAHGADDLLAGYRYVHAARKVVGVGSVGTRAWIVLLRGDDDGDPLFLQLKEAGPSVLEPFLAPSAFTHHGQRVVEGQWRMQAASDILLGWVSRMAEGQRRDFYVRQLWDWKRSADVERMDPRLMSAYGQMCGWTLARAHARTGDPLAIGAYLGAGARFDAAIADFSEVYADQAERDHARLAAAVQGGDVVAVTGV